MAGIVKGKCDIVFLLDATADMQPCIDVIRNNIKLFFGALERADIHRGETGWRARVIGYRDPAADGDQWLVNNPFVQDVASVEAQLDALVAVGGGDEPEGLLDALYKVASWGSTEKGAQKLDAEKWRYGSEAARCVIVFTDASYTSRTTLPDAPGLTWEDIANRVMREHLWLTIFAPQMDCYENLAMIERSEYIPVSYASSAPWDVVNAYPRFTADASQFQMMLTHLAKTVASHAYHNLRMEPYADVL